MNTDEASPPIDPDLAANPFGEPPAHEPKSDVITPINKAGHRRTVLQEEFGRIDDYREEVKDLNEKVKQCWDRCTKELGLNKTAVKFIYKLSREHDINLREVGNAMRITAAAVNIQLPLFDSVDRAVE